MIGQGLLLARSWFPPKGEFALMRRMRNAVVGDQLMGGSSLEQPGLVHGRLCLVVLGSGGAICCK